MGNPEFEAAVPDDGTDERRPPPARPPLGCGAAGGLLFAALFLPTAFGIFFGDVADPAAQRGLRAMLLGWSALAALLFGAATAGLVRRRARPDAPRRPPLWAAFMAMLILGLCLAQLAVLPLAMIALGLLG